MIKVRKQQVNYKSIHDAVRNGDVLQVEFMVKNGAGINEVESDTKFTPMHCACYMGALEVRSTVFEFWRCVNYLDS